MYASMIKRLYTDYLDLGVVVRLHDSTAVDTGSSKLWMALGVMIEDYEPISSKVLGQVCTLMDQQVLRFHSSSDPRDAP